MSSEPSPLAASLRDPWSWLIAALVGGLAWAVIDSAIAGLLIGAVVLAVAAAVGALRRSPARPSLDTESVRPDQLPLARPNSPAGRLVSRAETAVNRIRELSNTPGDPWLRDQVGNVDAESTQALQSLRVIAGRVTLVEQSIAAADPARLRDEAQRLEAQIAGATDPRLKAAQEESLTAVGEQIEVAGRLVTLRETLLARMEPAVLGLEGLSARMGEVVAMGPTAIEHDRAGELVSGLTDELEALRGGLDEAQRISDKSLPPGSGAGA